MEFKWTIRNVEHIAEHGIAIDEAEFAIEHAGKGFPKKIGGGKYLVRGQTANGEYIQAMFVFDQTGPIYVIHARPLTENEKRAFRRGR